MRLPPDSSKPVADLSDGELMCLFNALGRVGKRALRRALSLVPEIVRRGLFRRAGFSSPVDFACRKLEVSREVIERVLTLHRSIGHMPELWGLLLSGEEGWSKLEVVASVATPDTAAWWADLVLRCTRDELAEYVRRHKAQQRASAEASRASLWDRSGQPGGSSPASGPVQGGPATPEPSPGVVQPAPIAVGQSVEQSVEQSVGQSVGQSLKQSAEQSVDQLTDVSPAGDAGQGCREDSAVAPTTGTGYPASLPGFFGVPEGEAAPKLRAVTLYLRPEDDDLLRAFQAQYRREHRLAVSLGDVVGMLLRGEWPGLTSEASPEGIPSPGPSSRQADGEAPAASVSQHGGEEMDSPKYSMSLDAAGQARVSGDCGQPGMPDSSGQSGFTDTSGQAGVTHTSIPGASSSSNAHRGRSSSVAATLAGNPLLARRVEVVIRIAEVGRAWSRKLVGVLPAGIAETFRKQDAVVMGDLYALAVQAASRVRGDRIPAAVRKYVALRAGFRFEIPDCLWPIHDLDHIVPLAEGGSHHPDNLRPSCKLHHGVKHGNLFANAAEGTVISPGAPDRSGFADRAFQASRAHAVSGG